MTDFNYGALRSAAEFEEFVERILEAKKPFGFDVEAGYFGDPPEKDVALKPYHPNWLLAGFSFTNSVEWARYVPVAHDAGDNVDDPVRTAKALWRLLNSGLGVAHNAMYELNALGRWFRETLSNDPEVGEDVIASKGFFPIFSDSMIESFLVAVYDPIRVGQNLKGLTKHIFNHQMITFDELFEELVASKKIKTSQKRFNILPLDLKVVTYACEDALWCLALHRKHHPMLKAMPVYNTVYRAEIALLRVVAEMEKEGILLNWGAISSKAREVEELKTLMNEEIQQELSDRLGELVNINLASVPQLSEILFNRLGLTVTERSEKTGKPSTSEPALRAIAKEDVIVQKILRYREVNKLLGSYLKKYEEQLNYAGDGRAYPNHKQTGTVTGRFSVDGVSYQQWPKPYHYELNSGKVFDLNFRDLLISPPEYRIVGFDFSQVELRVLAGVAQESVMIRAFEEGEDIHKATASKMLGLPLEEVGPKERQLGKTINFAVVYGSGSDGLANLIGSTKDEAQEKLKQYFEAFPGIRGWMDEQIRLGHENGYIENFFGRRIKVWEFLDNRSWVVAKGERFCGNAPIQGGAGDYLKIGMVRVHKAIRDAGLEDKVRMIVTFHDALEFYVHDSVTTQEVIDVVGPAVSFPLPGMPEITADWHEGYQWGTLAEISLEDGVISRYEIGTTLPDGEKFEWSGSDLHDVLNPYYFWNREYYGETYLDRDYYLSKYPQGRNFQPKPQEETVEEATEDVEAPDKAVVTMPDMPLRSAWDKFKGFLSERPGQTELTVVTPEGPVTFDERYEISPQDQGKINLILGGASLSFPSGSTEDLFEGMEL